MRNEPYWGNRQSWNDEPWMDPFVPESYFNQIIRPDIAVLARDGYLDVLVAEGDMTAEEAAQTMARCRAWLDAHPEAK